MKEKKNPLFTMWLFLRDYHIAKKMAQYKNESMGLGMWLSGTVLA
jgi:hypothetical protein